MGPPGVAAIHKQVAEISREATKDAVEEVVTSEAAEHMDYEGQAAAKLIKAQQNEKEVAAAEAREKEEHAALNKELRH